MSYKVSVVIEKDEHGYYAYCPELEGCQTQGDSLKKVLKNINQAMGLYLRDISDDRLKALLQTEMFNPGDVVSLKSDDQLMTVEEYFVEENKENLVKCIWSSNNGGKKIRDSFNVSLIQKNDNNAGPVIIVGSDFDPLGGAADVRP